MSGSGDPMVERDTDPTWRREAAEAFELVRSFWYALATDDEAWLSRWMFPATITLNHLRPGSIAADWRAAIGLTAEDCRSIGHSNVVRRLPDGLYCVASLEGRRPAIIDTPTPAYVHAAIRDDNGQWRIWGSPDPVEFSRGHRIILVGNGPVA